MFSRKDGSFTTAARLVAIQALRFFRCQHRASRASVNLAARLTRPPGATIPPMDDLLGGWDGPGQIELPAPQDQVGRIVGDARLDAEPESGQAPITSAPTQEPTEDGLALFLVLVALVGVLIYGFTAFTR